MNIIKTPKNFDSDTVIWEWGGRWFKGKNDWRICVLKCPKCLRENYSLTVASWFCAWCGFNSNNQIELWQKKENL
jgi:ribosomal protein L37E